MFKAIAFMSVIVSLAYSAPYGGYGSSGISSSSYGGGGSSGDQLTGQQLRHHQRYDPCVDGAVEAYLNLPEASLAVRCCMTLLAPQLFVDASSCALLLHTHQRTQKINANTQINAHTHAHSSRSKQHCTPTRP